MTRLPDLGPGLVVCDAGPLISLGRIDALALLPPLFAQIQVPQQVLAECLARPGQADTQRIVAALDLGWLHECQATPLPGPAELGLGERAAIGRALELGAGLLADDSAARRHARALGLKVMGTLGVLAAAKRQGLIAHMSPLVERLRASGQRLDLATVAQALAAAGEPLA
jgi:predicted nucleic acid-binding protein